MRSGIGILVFCLAVTSCLSVGWAKESNGYPKKLLAEEAVIGGVSAAGGFLLGVPIGNLLYKKTAHHAGGGLIGGMTGWCIGGALGVYLAGEYIGDDSKSDALSLGTTLGAGLMMPALGMVLKVKWLMTWGTLFSPLVSWVTYNLVKKPAPQEVSPGRVERKIVVPVMTMVF
jgi:hypothetical protein